MKKVDKNKRIGEILSFFETTKNIFTQEFAEEFRQDNLLENKDKIYKKKRVLENMNLKNNDTSYE